MGKPMRIRHEHNIVEGMARDGREFGHLTENLRDGILNGAEDVEFGIVMVPHDDGTHTGLRYVADNGDGMSDDTLVNIYGDFGATGTNLDFEVELDDDGNVTVDAVEVDQDDPAHQRRGIGGRASIAVWNPAGLMAITLQKGRPRCVWMFRTIEGPFQMREWSDDGKPVMVKDPYVEPKYLDYDTVMIDKPYARALLIRSGQVDNVEEADEVIASMEDDDVIDNPYAGMDWQSYLPKWIVAKWKDGKGYDKDGKLAHGTMKILLGSHPGDSTAITGDPSFPNEASATRYEGAINNSWLDLSPWNVKVWSLSPTSASAKGFKQYTMRGYTRPYRLNGGKGGATELRGREQVGALAQRTTDTDIVLQRVLDLGKYGNALLLVTETEGKGKFPANRVDGIMAVVYGNELHGLSEANKLQAEGYQYRSMAIPGDATFHKRVSLILFPPRANKATGVEGVFQAYARDNLKWSGLDRLPLSDKGGINEAVRHALKDVPEIFELAHVDGEETSYVVDKKRYRHLKGFLKDAITGVTDRRKRRSGGVGGTSTARVRALIETKDGAEQGDPAEDHGKPTGERTICPECGQKVHTADCSRKPETSHSGEKGGRRGPLHKLTPDEKGSLTGRPTRAKVAGLGAKGETLEPGKREIQMNPPKVDLSEDPVETDDTESGHSGGMWPVSWNRPTELGPDTGQILVYADHLAIQALYAIARATGRNQEDAEKNAWKWISRRLTDALMGALELSEQRLDTKTKTGKLGLDGMADLMASKEWWLPVVSAMLADTQSLQTYVKATTAAAA